MINQYDFFYVYDKAIVDWIESYDFLTAINGTDNTVIDQVSVHYRPSNKDFGSGQAVQMQTDFKDNLPRISVSRVSIEAAPERSLGKINKYRKWDTVSIEGTDRYKQIIVPKAYNLSYQIDIQAKTDAHFLQMSSLILWDLDPDHTIQANLGDTFKTKWAHVSLQGVTDNSRLELTNGEAEHYRNTIDIQVDGWLFLDKLPSSVGPVKLIDITFKDYTTDEVFCELQVD